MTGNPNVWTTPAKLKELTARFMETNTPPLHEWIVAASPNSLKCAGRCFFDGSHVLVTIRGRAWLVPAQRA